MDKELLTIYMKENNGGDVIILDYMEQSSDTSDPYYYIKINYQIRNGRKYMTYSHIILQPWYDEWEQIFLRKDKLDKLIKKIKNGIQI